MPYNQCEELGPRTKLSSNPSPLIQLDGKPSIPEVSVLLDKEKVQFTCNEPLLAEQSINRELGKIVQQAEQTNRNCKESYSAWKAKNNQIYSSIQSDAKTEGFNKLPLQPSNSDNLKKKIVSSDTNACLPLDDSILNSNSKEQMNKKNSRLHERHFRQSEIKSTREIHNSNHRYIHCKDLRNEHSTCENGQQYKNSSTLHQIPDSLMIYKSSQEHERHLCKPSSTNSMQHNHNNTISQSSTPYDSQQNNQFNSCPQKYHGIENNCICSIQNRVLSENSRINKNDPGVKEQINQKDQKHINFQPFSTYDLSQINSQIIDLHNIIHHQNEQILILKQQILEIHYDCLKRSHENVSCQKCQGNYKVSQECDRNCLKDRGVHENGFVDKRSIGVMTLPLENNIVSKRSVGIMTVPQQYLELPHTNTLTKRVNKHVIEPIKHQTSVPTYGSLLHYQSGQRKMLRKEERSKIAQSESTPLNKKKSKEKSRNAQRENSFSLNEAEILIGTSIEQDDMSPNSSVHVDMQEYYSSSTESDYSDTTESCSEEDSQSRSDVEIESTGPQFGHTFYNLVVDQVNKIVQPTPPSQEQMSAKRIMTDHGYGVNEAFGMENNWSKRVTFDGPPLEDSDNQVPNILHGPRHTHQKHVQDYKGVGVPDRMKDFLLYNIADGSTNLSIASLRYLERYNLPNGKKHEPISEEQHTRKYNKKKKKKKRSPAVEADSNMHQHYYTNKKFNAMSSKLLDITALKQQPKLF